MSRNGIMIRRGDPEYHVVFCECFRWASYLAKVDTKGMAPRDVNEFSSSRIPHPSRWIVEESECPWFPDPADVIIPNT
jgi:hypothetical protein